MGLVMLASGAAWAGKTKVLYVTHEPGTLPIQ